MIGHNLDNPNYWPGDEPGPTEIKSKAMDKNEPRQLIKMGFTHKRTYPHGQYLTGVYENGPLRVKLTFEGGKLKTRELSFVDGFFLLATMDQLETLSSVLCKK